MHLKMIRIAMLGLILALSISQVAAAADEATSVGTTVDTEYIESLPASRGVIETIIKLNADGEESPFYGRYMDPFENDSFYLDRLYYEAWPYNGTIFRFDSTHSWDSSWRADGEWEDLGTWRVDFLLNDYEHFNIPSGIKAGRRDLHGGFSYGKYDGNIIDAGYTLRGSRSALEPGGNLNTIWETEDVDLGYTFNLGGWDSALQYKHRAFDANTFDVEDIVHSSWTFRSGRQLGDSAYVEGNLLYTESDLKNDTDMNCFTIGGYGRFINAFGVDRMNITSHINLEKPANGPMQLHPARDSFNFDIGAKWKATPDLKLNATYKFTSADHTYPNRTTILEYFANPERDAPDAGEILQNTITTNTINLGARYKFTDEFDASADWTALKRGGLENTDVRDMDSAYLWWDKENRYNIIFRYNPTGEGVINSGDWLLKYAKNEKSNAQRNSSVNDEHLTLDWTSMLNDDAWFYLGGGLMRTNSGLPELNEWRQRGREYGGGFSWNFTEDWNLNANYWNYDISGADGYDQTTFSAGIAYETDDNWKLGLTYENTDGSFDILQPLDYSVDRLLLNAGFEW